MCQGALGKTTGKGSDRMNEKSKRKPPAFQLYVAEFLQGTAMMSNEEVGIYIRLLCHAWDREGLPNDDTILCRLVGEPIGHPDGSLHSRFPVVLKKFYEDDDGALRNSRQETYRSEMRQRRQKLRENSKKGGEMNRLRIKAESLASQKAIQKGSQEGSQNTSQEGSQKGSQKGAALTLNSITIASEDFAEVSRDVLGHMNRALRDSKCPTSFKLNNHRRELIYECVKESGGDIEGVKQAITRMVSKWAGTKYAEALNPDSFFRPEKFIRYYEHRSFMVGNEDEEAPALRARVEAITSKFIDPGTGSFESEHRNSDGSLKPEAKEELETLKSQLKKC